MLAERPLRFPAIYVGAFWLVIFSTFYLAGVTPISPVYFGLGFAFICFVLWLGIKLRFRYSAVLLATLLYLSYTIIHNSLFGIFYQRRQFYIGMVSLLLALFFVRRLKTETIFKLSKRLVHFSLIIFFIEAIYRFNNPETFRPGFHKYKNITFMFADSNFVANVILVLYFFAYYLIKIKKRPLRKELFLLFIFSILSLSRAAIISIVLFTILFELNSRYARRIVNYQRAILVPVAISVLAVIAYSGAMYLYNYADLGVSYRSKFILVERTLAYIKENDATTLWLGGYPNLEYIVSVLGRGAHNIFIYQFFAGGLIGLILYILFWLFWGIKTHYKAFYIILPFWLCALSAAQVLGYIYIIFVTIYVLESRDI